MPSTIIPSPPLTFLSLPPPSHSPPSSHSLPPSLFPPPSLSLSITLPPSIIPSLHHTLPLHHLPPPSHSLPPSLPPSITLPRSITVPSHGPPYRAYVPTPPSSFTYMGPLVEPLDVLPALGLSLQLGLKLIELRLHLLLGTLGSGALLPLILQLCLKLPQLQDEFPACLLGLLLLGG